MYREHRDLSQALGFVDESSELSTRLHSVEAELEPADVSLLRALVEREGVAKGSGRLPVAPDSAVASSSYLGHLWSSGSGYSRQLWSRAKRSAVLALMLGGSEQPASRDALPLDLSSPADLEAVALLLDKVQQPGSEGSMFRYVPLHLLSAAPLERMSEARDILL